MLTPSAELAALGTILTQAAKMLPPAMAGGRVDRARRADAYVEFQRAAMGLITWAESMGPLQASAPPLWAGFASAVMVALPGLSPSERDGLRLARSTRRVSTLIFTRFLAHELDYTHSVIKAVASSQAEFSRILAALTEVRLLGGPRSRQPAEEVMALLGELLTVVPVHRRTIFGSQVSDDDRYRLCQRAAMDAFRRFTIQSALDLRSKSWMPWRRRDREHRWQIYRPKAPILQPVDIDIDRLLQDAALARASV